MSLIKVWTELIRSKFKEIPNILNNPLIKKLTLTLVHIYQFLIKGNISHILRVKCLICFNLRVGAAIRR